MKNNKLALTTIAAVGLAFSNVNATLFDRTNIN